MKKAAKINFWSIKKNSGVSQLSICYAIEFAKTFPEKKVLWITTNPFFCPVERSLNLKKDDYSKSIDTVIDYISDKNNIETNKVVVNEAITKIKNLDNLSLIFESNSKNVDYIKDNLKKFENAVMPVLEELFDIIIVDTASFVRSEVSRYFFRKSDLLVNVLLQNSIALDEYLYYKNELNSMIRNKVNIVNKYQENIQPTAENIRDGIEEEVKVIRNDPYFVSASNTGNLYNYYNDEESMITKDIQETMDDICKVLDLELSQVIEKKGILSKIFRK